MTSMEGQHMKTVVTAIRIIEAIETMESATLTRLADELSLPNSTIHDHLKTLESHRFVVRENYEYRLGLRFLEHGARARNAHRVFHAGESEIDELAETTGEFANLVIEEDGQAIYIHFASGQNAIEMNAYLGKPKHMHSTAVGKAILAFMPTSRVDEIVDRYGLPKETEHTISTRAELDDAFDTIRDQGFAVDREEGLRGLKCVAAPILDDDDLPIASASISGPASRFTEERLMSGLSDSVRRAANVIELNMTYS